MKLSDNDWSVFIKDSFLSYRFDVYVVQQFGEGRRRVLQPDGNTLEVLEYEAISGRILPTFSLSRDQLQAFTDALYDKGITPSGRRFKNEMDLIRAHLDDMRGLVFKEAKGEK